MMKPDDVITGSTDATGKQAARALPTCVQHAQKAERPRSGTFLQSLLSVTYPCVVSSSFLAGVWSISNVIFFSSSL